MAPNPASSQEPSDSELIDAVRHGSTDAFAQLYERHVNAAHNMARQVSRSATEADDLVSEAFAKMLDTLRAGRGPSTSFRAYLLTAVRNAAYDRTRRERKVRPTDDVAEVSGADASVPFVDTAVLDLERTLVAQAFARLPERWQTVLWHVEIERQSPAEVAPLLGLTPNGVSALAYRAREGLRQAYLQVHLGQLDSSAPGFHQCRAAIDRLGSWTRGGLSKRETAQVEAHLDDCERCRTLAAELAEVNDALRGVIGPMVLGSAAVGYLTTGTTVGVVSGGLGAGAATSAVSSLPRQTAVTSFSCAALAVAVALALSSAPGVLRPTAAPPPEPIVTPKPEPSREVAPIPPPPPPEPAPPSPQPPPTPAPAPDLDVSVPAGSLRLVAGGPAVELPITVRNTGGTTSKPISVAMSLPPGVSVRMTETSAGSGPASTAPAATTPASTTPASTTPASTTPASATPASTTPASARSAALAAPLAAPATGCTPISGGTRCTTATGLAPGESRTLIFSVQASADAEGGAITANISAGQQINVQLPTVTVHVEPRLLESGVDLEVEAEDGMPWLHGRVELEISNTGEHAGTAVASAYIPESVQAVGTPPECEPVAIDGQELRCEVPLEPGESFTGELWLTVLPPYDDPEEEGAREVTIPATAILGDSRDSDSDDIHLRYPGEPEGCPDWDDPDDWPIDRRGPWPPERPCHWPFAPGHPE